MLADWLQWLVFQVCKKKIRAVGVAASVLYRGAFGTVVTNTYGTTLMTAAKLPPTEPMSLFPGGEFQICRQRHIAKIAVQQLRHDGWSLQLVKSSAMWAQLSVTKVLAGMSLRDENGQFLKAKIIRVAAKFGRWWGIWTLSWYALVERSTGGQCYIWTWFYVVDRFIGNEVDLTELGYIVQNCIRLKNYVFPNSVVEFSWRQANEAAHNLTRVTTYMVNPQVFDNQPSCIHDFVVNEMTQGCLPQTTKSW